MHAIQENLLRLLALVLLTALSGMISASETALFALSRQYLYRLKKSPRGAASIVLRLREQPTELLSTVLLSNITVNILLYTMLGITAARLGEQPPAWLIGAAGAGAETIWKTVFGLAGFLVALMFAEIMPKLIALSIAEQLAPAAAVFLRFFEIITLPVRKVLNVTVVEPLTRILTTPEATTVGPEDLQRLIDISRSEGVLDARETTILHRLLDLGHLRVSAVMTPRVDLVAFNLDKGRSELTRLFRTSRLLRIPVYRGNIDDILGVVHAREFLVAGDTPIERLVRPVRFIPEQASCEAALRTFRETASQIAIVVDEYGGLAGILALEDVLEAIVGEIRVPEERSDLPPLMRIDDRTYLVDAGLDVHDFCSAFNLPLEETRIHTVGGLIAEALDRLPQVYDEVRLGHARLVVNRMKRRRIMQARLVLDEPVELNPDLLILLRESTQPHGESAQDGVGNPGHAEGNA